MWFIETDRQKESTVFQLVKLLESFGCVKAISIPGVLSKRIRCVAWLKNLLLSYAGNFLGSLFVAYFLAYQTRLLDPAPWLHFATGISEAKVSAGFWVLFLRGIGCNWLVCLAIWLAVASDDVAGKILGIWFPIMAFVALGFEHSIANMFFIPLGIFYGAQVSWYQFFVTNLIPVTVGNIVGGSLFVGAIYWFVYEYKVPDASEKRVFGMQTELDVQKTPNMNSQGSGVGRT